jgi:hypothetical protein
MDEKLKKYPISKDGLFSVVDTIGVPHPYCISPGHVAIAAERYGGMLGKAAIERAEREGVHCCICKGKLPLAEHKQALLVAVHSTKSLEELRGPLGEYLQHIKPLTEADGFEGWAFIQDKPKAEGGADGL